MQCCARKKNKVYVVEAQGNEKALVNASPSAGHLDSEISQCSVVPEKKNKVCAVEAQGNEKALVNASPSPGHLDPEIPRCSVVPVKKTKERCMRKMMEKVQ